VLYAGFSSFSVIAESQVEIHCSPLRFDLGLLYLNGKIALREVEIGVND
jgi:hypothetical protein